jgi:uncharacterized protein YukJ
LLPLPRGFTALPPGPRGGALDYVRGHLVERRRFRVARGDAGGLPQLLDVYVEAAIADPDAVVYAFGSRWGPKPRETDRTFRGHPIRPSDGIHDIHMNQGNVDGPGGRDDNMVRENAPWQDGALLIHVPEEARWVGVFLAFQSQVWHTDDATGRPLLAQGERGEARHPGPGEPDGRVRIVAALVNPAGPAPEAETVTLLNPAREAVDLRGWAILNSEKQPTRLRGELGPRATLTVPVSPNAPLRNRGGTITLVNERGLKVDGVAYTTRQAEREGWMLTFPAR